MTARDSDSRARAGPQRYLEKTRMSPLAENSGPPGEAPPGTRADPNRYSMFNGIGNRGFMSTMNLFSQQRPTQPTTPPIGEGSSLVNEPTQKASQDSGANIGNANSQTQSANGTMRDPKQTNPSNNMDMVGDVNTAKKTTGQSAGEGIPKDNPVPPETEYGEAKFSEDGSDATAPRVTVVDQGRQKSMEANGEAGGLLSEKSSEQDAPTPKADVPQPEGISMRKPQSPPGTPQSPTPDRGVPKADYLRKSQSTFSLKNPKMAPKMSIPKIRMPRMR